MGEEAGDKTEEPTPHKISEARKKGQVAHSKEITTAILLLFTYKLFASLAERIWYQLIDYANAMFRQMATAATSLDLSMANNFIALGIQTILTSIIPLVIPIFFLIILVTMLQTQFLFSGESLKPDLEKINPGKGLKRIFSLKGLVQILITIVKIVLIALVTWFIIKAHLQQVVNAMVMDPFTIMLFVGSLVMEIAMKVGMFYLALALLDYLYQRYDFHKSMMMTKQEVKEEYKRLEGDPVIKQAQRQRQREMSQRRQKGAVPGADVVVTNPVHLACAIRYKPDIDKAPVLVAKGLRIFAEEIKQVAEEYFVPIVENETLARTIYDTTDVGEEVSPELYRAVAEVLAFVYKLGRNKKKNRNKPIVNRS